MADEMKPGFSMEVSGTDKAQQPSKKNKKVKQEIGAGLIVVAIVIIVGFAGYWYLYAPKTEITNPDSNLETPPVVVDMGDVEGVLNNLPSLSVPTELPDATVNPLEDVYENPFN